MDRIAAALARAAAPGGPDRGEVGPIGYAVMVAGIVLLALAVVSWGNDIAELFMGKLENIDLEPTDAG